MSLRSGRRLDTRVETWPWPLYGAAHSCSRVRSMSDLRGRARSFLTGVSSRRRMQGRSAAGHHSRASRLDLPARRHRTRGPVADADPRDPSPPVQLKTTLSSEVETGTGIRTLRLARVTGSCRPSAFHTSRSNGDHILMVSSPPPGRVEQRRPELIRVAGLAGQSRALDTHGLDLERLLGESTREDDRRTAAVRRERHEADLRTPVRVRPVVFVPSKVHRQNRRRHHDEHRTERGERQQRPASHSLSFQFARARSANS